MTERLRAAAEVLPLRDRYGGGGQSNGRRERVGGRVATARVRRRSQEQDCLLSVDPRHHPLANAADLAIRIGARQAAVGVSPFRIYLDLVTRDTGNI